ncbi:UDP-glucosyltransferase 2-like [Frankliniella occidentalis]|uniref:UDP-glucosyltransferase 2-like n=1 Tax=Frankliniella occidentalis TaxID=133901 RepID=A0A6J1TUA2_FRAOC|nr:UDP-glucosyltransferase 2-like [Frankliniella occidentalis]
MTSTRWVLACALLLSAATGLQHQAPFSDGPTAPSNILMVTMGGTRSHKVPFMALGRALVQKGHNVTFLSAFPPARDSPEEPGFEEITPLGLVLYVRNYTDWDLVGARFRGEEPVPWDQALAYTYETCDHMLSDPETQHFLHSGRHFDLLILDGAYPECAVGLAHHFNAPFMYINTVGFHLASVSTSGSPVPYATTPFLSRGFTDKMTLLQRAENTFFHTLFWGINNWLMSPLVQNVLNKHFPTMPPVGKLTKNVSFILQNAHHTVSYPRPYLPNVAEIACIHCREARPLPKALDDFVRGGKGNGFIFVSMGSSVRATNMPELLRLLFLRVFAQLPYQVLWKWEFGSESMPDLPPNVRLERWLPQQDLLGHPKIAAFLTHGGLLSMFETVYHGVPVVTLPVFCDHDANSAKAHDDGYAIRLELQHLSADELHAALQAVTEDPKYRAAAKYRQAILRDQSVGPLRTAVYWTEYVLRHRGAAHLQAPVRDMPLYQWLLLDVMVVYALIAYVAYKTIASMARFAYRSVVSAPAPRASSKANGVLPNGLANDIANGVANGIANGVAHSLSSGVTSGKKTN